jgi:hypothetical protein
LIKEDKVIHDHSGAGCGEGVDACAHFEACRLWQAHCSKEQKGGARRKVMDNLKHGGSFIAAALTQDCHLRRHITSRDGRGQVIDAARDNPDGNARARHTEGRASVIGAENGIASGVNRPGLVLERMPILAVRDWMGHASVQETEGYLHRSRASHARSIEHLDAYVSA